jgi:phage terminase large subunit-like protein
MVAASPVMPAMPAKSLIKADVHELAAYYKQCREMSNEWIRRQVLVNNRIDILSTAVLGLEVQPFHQGMLQFQFRHRLNNLQLAPRGAGKSTLCTEVKCIHLLLKDPNLRILLASKTAQNAEGFLRGVKNHIEGNDRLAEIFGPMYDPKKTWKWDTREIEVLGRTKPNKEASITCVGADGTIVSKHFDVIIEDDVVDEENARTKHQRDKLLTWAYQTLDPTLEPPDPFVLHRGEHHRLGTRYHHDDYYGHLIRNELSQHHNIIPALDEHGRSLWPEKYPAEWYLDKRRRSGIIIFNAQYQNNTDAMKGEIFQYDDCQRITDKEFPDESDLQVFMGIDLAISEEEANDKFAIVVIGTNKARTAFYCLDYYEGQLRFNAQTAKIREVAKRWDPVRICIEANAYQKAQYHNLKHEDSYLRVVPVYTDKDKVTRAWKLSALFEEKKMFFRESHANLIEHLVLFPNHKFKDLFDAYDLAVRASKVNGRKKREKEPGLI